MNVWIASQSKKFAMRMDSGMELYDNAANYFEKLLCRTNMLRLIHTDESCYLVKMVLLFVSFG